MAATGWPDMAGLGKASRGSAVLAPLGFGRVWLVRAARVWPDVAGLGKSGQRRRGTARHGGVRRGSAWSGAAAWAWLGADRIGKASLGIAVAARLG
jgi:hypothetical protein